MGPLTMLKRALKRMSQHAFALTGRHRWRQQTPQLLILTYHRVLPPDHPDRFLEQPGMIVEPDVLRLQLEAIGEYFDFVDLAEWLDALNSNRSLPAMACAITFDDGWTDNFHHAFPILEERAVPATIFLVTDLVGTDTQFWPNRLQRLLTLEPLPQQLEELLRTSGLQARQIGAVGGASSRDLLIAYCKARPDAAIIELLDQIEAEIDTAVKPPDLLDWHQVDTMERTGLIRFGSHGATHTRLVSELDTDVLEREVNDSLAVLEERTQNPARIFCYPNGDSTPDAARFVRAAYAGALLTDAGWNDQNCDRYSLRRISIHNDVAYDRTSFLGRIGAWI